MENPPAVRTRTSSALATRDRGFTLIEILVVVIVIGVLAAIAIPVFLNQRKKAVEATQKADMRALLTDARAYVYEKGEPDTAYSSNQQVFALGGSGTVADGYSWGPNTGESWITGYTPGSEGGAIDRTLLGARMSGTDVVHARYITAKGASDPNLAPHVGEWCAFAAVRNPASDSNFWPGEFRNILNRPTTMHYDSAEGTYSHTPSTRCQDLWAYLYP